MNIIQITDFADPALDVYARTTENQLLNRANPDEGIFIAESPYVINLALQAGCQPLSVLAETGALSQPVLQKCKGIPIYTADNALLQQLTGFKLTLGLLCAMRRPAPRTVESVCRGAGRLAVLEHVMNPTNVGAIMRSAAALGMDGVLLSDDCADPLYRRASRVSMGTVFQIPWAYFDKGEPYKNIERLRSLGFQSVAMALREDSLSLRDPLLQQIPRLAIVMGSEGEGLTDRTISACDHTVMIPMAYGVDSLNVAGASALAFWQLGRGM